MKIETKKIIAREFLILILAVAISGIVFLTSYIYNSYQKSELAKVDKKIESNRKTAENLLLPIKKKKENQNWLYNKLIEVIDMEKLNTAEKFWSSDIDVIENVADEWNNKNFAEITEFYKSLQFHTSEELKEYIRSNYVTVDDRTAQRNANLLLNEVSDLTKVKSNTQKRIVSNEELVILLQNILLLLVFFLFLLRYLGYCILWSIRTLRNK